MRKLGNKEFITPCFRFFTNHILAAIPRIPIKIKYTATT